MTRHPDFRYEQPVIRRPHAIAPDLSSVYVVLISHLMPMAPGSDAGLSSIITAEMRILRRAHVHCICRRAANAEEVTTWLEAQQWTGNRPVTHVVINTYGFITGHNIAALAAQFDDIEFIVLNHSGQSFLHIDPNAMDNVKAVLDLQNSTHNVVVAGNNSRFVAMCRDSFGVDVTLLPNLYDINGFTPNPPSRQGFDPLRIGTFGALREAKNQSVAQQAALGMARRRRVHLEWHVLGKRFDSANHILQSRQRLYSNIPSATIIEHDWCVWSDFIKIVEDMDILLMPSFDETFCCVVADGIRMGVPSVVTPAMEWAPWSWQCQRPYDPEAVMHTGMALLGDHRGAVHDGRCALTEYVEHGTIRWINHLIR